MRRLLLGTGSPPKMGSWTQERSKVLTWDGPQGDKSPRPQPHPVPAEAAGGGWGGPGEVAHTPPGGLVSSPSPGAAPEQHPG